MPSISEPQMTFAKSAAVSGTSLHTGEKVTLKVQPAPPDSGIKFRRKDLQEEPMIDARIENLKTVERATTIGEGSVRVHTVEHVLAALSAMGIDNADRGDGCERTADWRWQRATICRVDKESGRRRAGNAAKIFSCARAVARRVEDRRDDRASAGRQVPHFLHASGTERAVHTIFFHRNFAGNFRTRNRTGADFVYYEDVQPLMEKNLIKGGSLENAVVVRGDAVMSKEPLRFA